MKRKWKSWRTTDIARLKEMRRLGMSIAQIAKEFDRGFSAVACAIQRFGLKRYTPTKVTAGFIRFVKSQNNKGLNDAQIAAMISCHVSTVRNTRKMLGLPARLFNDIQKTKIRKRMKQWCAENGYESLAQAQHQQEEIALLKSGWPVGLRPNECRILDALESGPKSRRELRDILGISHLKIRNTTWTARLEQKGYIKRVGKRHHRAGSGFVEVLYSLNIERQLRCAHSVNLKFLEAA